MKFILNLILFLPLSVFSQSLEPGSKAPLFEARDHEGKTFKLSDRKDKGWTVLFFYPKADTPGCTKQACAFRDSLKIIQEEGAEVFGISADNVEEQSKFHKKYKLNFKLLADPNSQIIELYKIKMPFIGLSKRWTFILDKDLYIRRIEKDVDPMLDAQRVAEWIKTNKK